MTSTQPTDLDGGGSRWILDGAALGQVDREIGLTYDGLELTVRSSHPDGLGWGDGGWGEGPWGGEVGTDWWRQWDRAGDYTIEDEYGGSWSAVATGSDDNDLRVTLEPPEHYRPPFAVAEYMVDSVTTVRESPEETIVDVDLVRTGPREYALEDAVAVGEPDESTHTAWGEGGWGEGPWGGYGTHSWSISLVGGNLELREEFVGRPERSSATAGETLALELALDDAQAAVLVDTLGRLDGIVEHSVPGGADVIRDTTPDGMQTIELDPPSTDDAIDGIEAGWYHVRDWSLEPLGALDTERPWLVDLELTRRTD